MRDKFMFKKSYYMAIQNADASDRLWIYETVCALGLSADEMERNEILDSISAPSPLAQSIAEIISQEVKEMNDRYDRAKTNGAKGGRTSKYSNDLLPAELNRLEGIELLKSLLGASRSVEEANEDVAEREEDTFCFDSEELEKEFSSLWKLYPNKKEENKGLAKRSYALAVNGVSFEELVDAINNESQNDLPQFHVWLDSKGWKK